MTNYKFNIIPGNDKEYVDAFDAMKAEGEFIYERIQLDYLGEVGADGVSTNQEIMQILEVGERAIPSMNLFLPRNLSVGIRRSQDHNSPFDTVTVNRPAQATAQEAFKFAKLVATVQKHLGKTSSLVDVGNLLGPSVKQHFEAREVALARLEKMASTMLGEMEKARKQRDEEFQERQATLEEKYDKKEQELQATIAKGKDELDRRSIQLDDRSKVLDDRAAKHARRQHYKDIKSKFETWSKTFEVTPGTKSLRRYVFWSTIILMLLFGSLAGWFLFQSFTAADSWQLIHVVVKQVTFTALFVTTTVFFIRWNNQWFQRHANEEFHLKRMEMDIDRASWFVEMAFEWKDEKGDEIPEALINRLTQGLFKENRGDHAVEPTESIVHALLGAARLKVKLPGDVEAEYDRREVKRLAKMERKEAEGERT